MRNDYARFSRGLNRRFESLEIIDHRCEIDNVEWCRYRTFRRAEVASSCRHEVVHHHVVFSVIDKGASVGEPERNNAASFRL